MFPPKMLVLNYPAFQKVQQEAVVTYSSFTTAAETTIFFSCGAIVLNVFSGILFTVTCGMLHSSFIAECKF
jgi:hypothetical protein